MKKKSRKEMAAATARERGLYERVEVVAGRIYEECPDLVKPGASESEWRVLAGTCMEVKEDVVERLMQMPADWSIRYWGPGMGEWDLETWRGMMGCREYVMGVIGESGVMKEGFSHESSYAIDLSCKVMTRVWGVADGRRRVQNEYLMERFERVMRRAMGDAWEIFRVNCLACSKEGWIAADAMQNLAMYQSLYGQHSLHGKLWAPQVRRYVLGDRLDVDLQAYSQMARQRLGLSGVAWRGLMRLDERQPLSAWRILGMLTSSSEMNALAVAVCQVLGEAPGVGGELGFSEFEFGTMLMLPTSLPMMKSAEALSADELKEACEALVAMIRIMHAASKTRSLAKREEDMSKVFGWALTQFSDGTHLLIRDLWREAVAKHPGDEVRVMRDSALTLAGLHDIRSIEAWRQWLSPGSGVEPPQAGSVEKHKFH